MPRTDPSLTPLDVSAWLSPPGLIPFPPDDLEWTPEMRLRAIALQHLLPWQLELVDQWERTVVLARQRRELQSSSPFYAAKAARARTPEAYWRGSVMSCGGMKIL